MDKMTTTPSPRSEDAETLRRGLWIALLTGASVVFSLAFKCATPFAALAALAALNMRRGDAVALIAIVWLVNQAIGFGVLHYPHTLETYDLGVAIGVAALLALAGAMGVAAIDRLGQMEATAAAFGVAFVVYEAALYATSVLTGEGRGAFAPPIVGKVLEINVLALVGLLVLHQVALGLRLAPPRGRARGVAARA